MFQESGTVQPSLLETMRLSSGVQLKEGDQAKHGPEASNDPLRMSRREFMVTNAVSSLAWVAGSLTTALSFLLVVHHSCTKPC